LINPDSRDQFLREFISLIRCLGEGHANVGYLRQDLEDNPIHKQQEGMEEKQKKKREMTEEKEEGEQEVKRSKKRRMKKRKRKKVQHGEGEESPRKKNKKLEREDKENDEEDRKGQTNRGESKLDYGDDSSSSGYGILFLERKLINHRLNSGANSLRMLSSILYMSDFGGAVF